mmetsp:Transcript_6309/g.10938  ORF Transcript_6309/g.10938 Transcript_6309/m.10938 type:complete len:206 (-) Transcript_6309:21-638(-)
MMRDCNEDCWQGRHMAYSVVCSISILVYFIITVFNRPVWQSINVDLHVQTRKAFYLQKCFVEVSILVARRCMRRHNELEHSFVFFVLILSHLGVTLIKPPFNYKRYDMWFRVSMLIVLSYSVLSTLQLTFNFFTVEFTLLVLGASSLALVGFGALYQWRFTKGLLLSPDHPQLTKLFKFAFTLKNVKPPYSQAATRTQQYTVVSS